MYKRILLGLLEKQPKKEGNTLYITLNTLSGKSYTVSKEGISCYEEHVEIQLGEKTIYINYNNIDLIKCIEGNR